MYYSLLIDELVTNGTIVVDVKLNNVTIHFNKSNLCKTIQQRGMTCPLAKGQYTIQLSEAVPRVTPTVSQTNYRYIGLIGLLYFIEYIVRCQPI